MCRCQKTRTHCRQILVTSFCLTTVSHTNPHYDMLVFCAQDHHRRERQGTEPGRPDAPTVSSRTRDPRTRSGVGWRECLMSHLVRVVHEVVSHRYRCHSRVGKALEGEPSLVVTFNEGPHRL